MSPILSGLGGITVKGYGHFGPVRDTGAMFPLQVITVGPAGASSVSFTNIPNTYTHLQVRLIGRDSPAATVGDLRFRFNSDSGNNYTYHSLQGDGSSAISVAQTATNYGRFGRNTLVASSSTASVFCANIVDILDYSNTNKNKTVRTLAGYDTNGSGRIELLSSLWMSTSAITSIEMVSDGGSFVQYTQFALYGVKSA